MKHFGILAAMAALIMPAPLNTLKISKLQRLRTILRIKEVRLCVISLYELHLPGRRLRTDYTDADPDLEADFYILRHTTAPAVLTENFFMDSHPDCAFLLSEEGQQALVDLHVTGITAYLSTL